MNDESNAPRLAATKLDLDSLSNGIAPTPESEAARRAQAEANVRVLAELDALLSTETETPAGELSAHAAATQAALSPRPRGRPLGSKGPVVAYGEKRPERSFAPVKGMRLWYDALIDWMIANPQKSRVECAAYFNRDPTTISRITSSDLFRARYEQRRAEFTARFDSALVETSQALALDAMNEVHKRVKTNPDKIPIGLLHDISTKTLERLGYGPKPPTSNAPGQPGQTSVSVSLTVLNEAKAALRDRGQTLTLTATEEPGAKGA